MNNQFLLKWGKQTQRMAKGGLVMKIILTEGKEGSFFLENERLVIEGD